MTEAEYDGSICTVTMELHSDDPDYYEKKSNVPAASPNYQIYLAPYEEITKQGGCGPEFTVEPEGSGSVIRYSYFFIPQDAGGAFRLYIGDITEGNVRNAGYIEMPVTIPDSTVYSGSIKSAEFGNWTVKLSAYGFEVETRDNNYFLDPEDRDVAVVYRDGREEHYTATSTGIRDQSKKLQQNFGTFHTALKLDDIYSLTLYGQTIVLDELNRSSR